MRLKVVVRVRPMSQREKNSGTESVVAVETGNNIAVTNIRVPKQNAGDSRERVRRFAFDYCFAEDATQDQVFETVESIIGNSLKSRCHSCVLAYGQTSSGKTHTMMGFPQDPGLTPRLCRRIFKYFEDGALNDETTKMKISVSYLEIYNEKVADLLTKNDQKGKPERHLKVREHPKKGPYVEGLSEHIVTNDTELLERLETGTSKRRVGSTSTNPRSSRSHSVFSVCCDGVKLHLVDLAGNERAGSRGYGPSRFREGANINKSLVALGNVISTLADQSRVSPRNKFVPYRDSVLTWLLKDTLQGNSNTVMIATVSPSSACYSETVNTLRFGQRAKLIVYRPVIVEDPKEKTIRELRAEIAKLRDILRLSEKITPSINPEEPMSSISSQSTKQTAKIPINIEPRSDDLQDHSLSEQSATFSRQTSPETRNPEKASSKNESPSETNGQITLNSPDTSAKSFSSSILSETPSLEQNITTTEKLLPVMNITTSIPPATPKKLKRTFSMDRTYSTEGDNSKSCSSQESLQSPKHTVTKSTKSSSPYNARESLSISSNQRRLSSGSSGVQPKQTALSLKRQTIHKSNPSLKTITQKRILGSTPKRQEKGIVTEQSGLKKAETKIDTNRRPSTFVKPRSQIVAAVTSRLYSKVNKKEASTITENIEAVEEEAPKELSICSNARNRLRELTQKALKAHRSRNEETQTDRWPVLRLKEVGTDCSDLKIELVEVKDAATNERIETKDAEVGCMLLNHFLEKDLKNIWLLTRSCGIQTIAEDKGSGMSFKKYLTEPKGNPIFTDSVNINISHNYINGSRTGSLSDDSLDDTQRNTVSFPTPDLISNHNSLEQHALNIPDPADENKESIENKMCFSESHVFPATFDSVTCIPTENVCATNATCLTVPPFKTNFKMVDVLSTHAPQMISSDVFKEKCRKLPDFCPDVAKPKIVEFVVPKSDNYLVFDEPTIVLKTEDQKSTNSGDSSTTEDNSLSDIPDSMEYHITNHKKVQFLNKNKKPTNERLLKAMSEFLNEAKLLMTNIASAAGKANHPHTCHQPHLEDFDIQVTVNDVSGIDKTKRKKKKNRGVRESNSTQTEKPQMESCFSQTSLEFPEYMVPTNKYEALLEDSCKRLEAKIKRAPRSRHISIASEECDEELFDGLDHRHRYNPWDLSNVEVEDSSLESNPVSFSDYGSLPRKTHKRQRTPTCSPSAFLRQLTSMRRQIIESSREELLNNGGSK